jgi:uncharacterized spore protein YtfJ
MAEKEGKNNFTLIVGACAAISIALVLVLKADEVKHLELKGAGTTLEGNASALHEAKRFKNEMME